MQTFHLESSRANRTSAFRLVIAKEQAEGLGLAGKKLQESIDRFNEASRDAHAAARHDDLLSEVAARAWALIVQRELVGFVHENQKWVVEHFNIPNAALRIMGRSRCR